MIRLTWFARRKTQKQAPKFRTTLSLNQLECREVPAASNFNPVAAAHANPKAAAHASPRAAIVSPSPTQTSSISGIVQLDNGTIGVPNFAYNLSISINGNEGQPVSVSPDGSYTFTVPLDGAATYTLRATMADGGELYVAQPSSGTLQPGQQITGTILTFRPNG